MKRSFAAAVTAAAVIATAVVTSMTVITSAAASPSRSPGHAAIPSARIQVVPGWTYQGNGEIAVIATCSQRQDLRVITSVMLPHPVSLRHGGKLLIRVTGKTWPGKYTLMLLCMTKGGQPDALAVQRVKVVKRLPGWKQPPAPGLPRHFRADVTVRSGPPAR